MKRLLLGAITAALLAGPAIAADMRVKPRAYVPPPAFSWTGCYLGGFAGGAWSKGADFTDLGNTTRHSYSGGSSASNILPSHSWGVGDSGGSFIGGGTLGCNWQPVGSAMVLGLEGELGYLKLRGSTFDPNTLVGTQNTLDVLGSASVGNWYGMITGRLGYAYDRVLIYVKGGAAFVRTQASVLDQCGTPNPGPGCGNWLISTSGSQTPTVGTFGGGIEWAFGQNWTVKGEYMFIGLHNGFQTSGLATIVPSGNTFSGGPFVFNHRFNGINTVKVGLNYRFNWWNAPIATRY
jgi:outer membrane immunogenic protein